MSLAYPLPKGTRQSADMVANGVTTSFPYSFRVLDATDLLVLTKPAGSSDFAASPVLGVDYTVSGVGLAAGGAVNFLTPPASGLVRLMGRRTPSRLTSVVNAGVVVAAALELEFDALEITLQELRRDYDMAMSLQAMIAATPYATLPPTRGQSVRALKANSTTGLNWLTAVQAALPNDESADANIAFNDPFWPIGGVAWTFVQTTLAVALGGFTPTQLLALQAQAVANKVTT